MSFCSREVLALLMEGGEDLDAELLELLAVAADLIGRDQDCVRAWERAHAERLQVPTSPAWPPPGR